MQNVPNEIPQSPAEPGQEDERLSAIQPPLVPENTNEPPTPDEAESDLHSMFNQAFGVSGATSEVPAQPQSATAPQEMSQQTPQAGSFDDLQQTMSDDQLQAQQVQAAARQSQVAEMAQSVSEQVAPEQQQSPGIAEDMTQADTLTPEQQAMVAEQMQAEAQPQEAMPAQDVPQAAEEVSSVEDRRRQLDALQQQSGQANAENPDLQQPQTQ